MSVDVIKESFREYLKAFNVLCLSIRYYCLGEAERGEKKNARKQLNVHGGLQSSGAGSARHQHEDRSSRVENGKTNTIRWSRAEQGIIGWRQVCEKRCSQERSENFTETRSHLQIRNSS